MPFNYYRTVTIDHTKVLANQSDFPVLVSLTHADLKTVGNGGHVENASGFDIVFFSDGGLTSQLKFDLEKFDATTGEIIFWVKLATISSSVDDVFYVAYGDAAISTFQGDAVNVWDSNYKCVYHLGGSGPSLVDSSPNAKNLTAVGTAVTPRTGQVDGGADFTAAGAVQRNNAFGNFTPPWTFQAWIQLDASGVSTAIAHSDGTTGTRLGAYNGGSGTVNFPFYSIYGVGGPNFTTLTFNQGDLVFIAVRVSTNGLVAIAYLGSAAGAWTTETGVSTLPSATPNTILLGAKGGAGGDLLDGLIDEARFSIIERSENWLHTEFNNQFSPSTFHTLGAEQTSSVNRTAADAVSITDGFALEVGILIVAGDALSLSDDIGNSNIGADFTVGDTVNLSDSASILGAGFLEFGDTLSLTDAITVDVFLALSFGDAVSISDNLANPANTTGQVVGDALFLLDEVGFALFSAFVFGDALSLNDSALLSLPAVLEFGDALDLSDAVVVQLVGITILTISVGDAISVSDGIALGINADLNDYLRRYLNDVPLG